MLINSFTGRYSFLSNFYAAPLIYKNVLFPTVEHAFQAAKSKDPEDWDRFSQIVSPGTAKKEGRKLKLRKDWDEARLVIMKKLLDQKFSLEPLRFALVATGKSSIVHGNYWGDTFWGISGGEGEDHLGKLLVRLRRKLVKNGDA